MAERKGEGQSKMRRHAACLGKYAHTMPHGRGGEGKRCVSRVRREVVEVWGWGSGGVCGGVWEGEGKRNT